IPTTVQSESCCTSRWPRLPETPVTMMVGFAVSIPISRDLRRPVLPAALLPWGVAAWQDFWRSRSRHRSGRHWPENPACCRDSVGWRLGCEYPVSRYPQIGFLADQLVDVVAAVGIGDHFGHFAGLQIHDRLLVRRQRGAAHLLHLSIRGVSRESSVGVGLLLQLVRVFTLSCAGSDVGSDFLHCCFSSFLLRLDRRLRRRGFRTGLLPGLRSRNGRFDLFCAGNKNPRKSRLLVGGFLRIVIVLDIAVCNFTGIFLQHAAQFLGKNLHARKANLFFERGPFVEAPFLRHGGHLEHARIGGCELATNSGRHSRLQRFGELLKLRAADQGFAGVTLLRGIGAETLQGDHRIIGTNFYFGGLIGRGGGALFRLGSGGGRWSRWRGLSEGQASEQETHEARETHESISSREKLRRMSS